MDKLRDVKGSKLRIEINARIARGITDSVESAMGIVDLARDIGAIPKFIEEHIAGEISKKVSLEEFRSKVFPEAVFKEKIRRRRYYLLDDQLISLTRCTCSEAMARNDYSFRSSDLDLFVGVISDSLTTLFTAHPCMLTTYHILLPIDDSERLREALRRSMRLRGYKCKE